MHQLLKRQLEQHFGSLDNVPEDLKPFIEAVNQVYTQYGEPEPRRQPGRSGRVPTVPRYRLQHSQVTKKSKTKGRQPRLKGNGRRLAIPIKLRDQTLGALNLKFEDEEAARKTAPVLHEVSNRLAIAIENASLFQETQLALARTNALLQVSRSAIAFESLPDLLQTVVDEVAKTLPADRVTLITFDTQAKKVTNFVGGGPGIGNVVFSVPYEELLNGLSGWVMREHKPAISPKDVPDPRESPEVQKRRRETNCGSIIVVPLMFRDNILGTMTAINTPAQPDFTEQDAELMLAMANQTAAAIENALLFEQQQRRTLQLQTAAEVSRAASSILDLNELLPQAVELIRERFELYYVGIFLVDDANEWAILRAGTGEAGRVQLERNHRLAVGGESMIGQAVATGKARIALDVGEEAVRFQNPLLPDTHSELALPLRARGRVIGALTVQSTEQAAFSPEDVTTLQTMADQLANAIDNARLFEQTQARAQELAILNEMGHTLASRLEHDRIIEHIERYTNRLIQSTSFVLALYDKEQDLISFPLVIEEGEKLNIAPRQAANGLVDYVINNKTPLLISENLPARAEELGVDHQTVGKPALSWLGVPILIGDEIIGMISVQSVETPRLYSERDLNLLLSIANQAASALQNAKLFAQTEQQNAELAILNEMSRELSATLDLEHTFELIYQYTARLMDATNFYLALYYPEQDEIEFKLYTHEGKRVTLRDQKRKAGKGLTEYIIRTRRPLLIQDDALAHIQQLEGVEAIGKNASSWLGVPMIVRDQVLGVIALQSYTTPRLYNERHQDLLTSIASQAAIAIQNANLFNQFQRRNEELALINRVVARVSAVLDVRESLQIVCDELGKAIGAGRVGVALLNDAQSELTVIADYRADPNNPSAVGVKIPVEGNPATQHVLSTRKSLVIEDAQNDPMLAPLHQAFRERGIKSVVIIPLLARNEVMGTIGLDIMEGEELFSDDQLELAETIIFQASTAIYNARLYNQTQEALAETAALYQASAEINRANTNEEILDILRKYTLLKDADTNVSINLFDRPWEDEMPEWSIPIARWTRLPSQALLPRYPLKAFPAAKTMLLPDQPTIVEDIANDPRPDEATKKLYIERFKASSTIFVPLVVSGKWIGYINGIYSTPYKFSEKGVRLLSALTAQAAISIQNIRLLEETRKRAAQLLTAAEIARDTSETLAQDELLKRAVNLILNRFGYYHAAIYLLDDAREWAIIRQATGKAGEEMLQRGHKLAVGSQSVVGSVTYTGEPLVVNDVSQDAIHHPNPLLPDTRAELGIPLKIGQRVIGALDVQSTQIDAFTPDDVAVLQTLADQIAVAVDNAKSYELAQQAFQEARARVQELTTLFDVSEALTSAALLSEQIGEIVATKIATALGEVTTCAILLHDPETDMMHTLVDVTHTQGEYVKTENPEQWDYRLSEYPATKRVMDTMQPLLVHADDPDADPAELRYLQEVGAKSLLIFPLAYKGQTFGIIELETWEEKLQLSPERMNLGMAIANQAAAALENARLYEEQLRTAEQLRELDKLKNQFLANMSHELRTPLNSIIGFSRVILKGIDGPITELQEQDLKAIHSAGQHLLGLINDILDLSRIEAGKMELNITELDLAPVITGVMATTRGLIKEKPIRLEHFIEPDLPKVMADETRVRQVLLNLLQNAAKFTEEGYIRVRAERQIGPDDQLEVVVSVTDTGIGIAPEDQSKLFLPFSQVDSSATRKSGGTGLGLSISRNLIEMQGGRIEMVSEVGKGSTFSFTLPAIPENEPIEIKDGRKIVLAIDDDPKIIELYKRYLDSTEYQVVPLTDATQAVDMATQLQPFAITLDIRMPNQDGWEVMRALKSNPETKDIPVILCTIVEEEAKGHSLGAAEYLLKPILKEDLIDALNRLNGGTNYP